MVVQFFFVFGFDSKTATTEQMGEFAFLLVIIKRLPAAEAQEEGKAGNGCRFGFTVPHFLAGGLVAWLFGRGFCGAVLAFDIGKVLVNTDV